MKYVVLEKKIGETPLMRLQAFRESNPELKDVSLSYAGRLDPMAEGKLLVLVGEECKNQKEYHALDKEYEVDVLLDIGSDTGDALGIVSYSGYEIRVDSKNLARILASEAGAHRRPYPAYSSKTVDGKPLFLHALSGTLSVITIPEHVEFMHRITYRGSYQLTKSELQEGIKEFLSLVPKDASESKQLGRDFRISAVAAGWNELFEKTPERSFTVLRLRVVCGAGSYMRALAERVGNGLGTKALALRIRRTKLGKYWKGLWLKSF